MRHNDAADAHLARRLHDGERLLPIEMAGRQHEIMIGDDLQRPLERGHLVGVAGIEREAGALRVELRVLPLDAPRFRQVAAVVAAQVRLAAECRHPHDETIGIRIGRGHIPLPSRQRRPNAMIVDAAAAEIERNGADQRHLVVRPAHLADLGSRGLEMVLHDHAEPFAPRLGGKRLGAISPAQEFGTDMDVHVDHAFVADTGQRFHG